MSAHLIESLIHVEKNAHTSYPLTPSYETHRPSAQIDWAERLVQVQEKVSEKRIHLTKQRQELKRMLAEIKKLEKEHTKEKHAYSISVNERAQKLHDSIIRYESAREKKESLLELQHTLNGNYDKLYEKAQEIKAKQQTVEQDRKTKAHEHEQQFLSIKDQLFDAKSDLVEMSNQKQELLKSLQCISSKCYEAAQGYMRILDGPHFHVDSAMSFCGSLLENIHAFSQDISGHCSQSANLKEMYEEVNNFHERFQESISTMRSELQTQAHEIHKLYQKLKSTAMESQKICMRLRERARLLVPESAG